MPTIVGMSDTPASFDLEPMYKQNFATFLSQGFSPFLAALKIWGQEHAGFCYGKAEEWVKDPYVLECVAKLKEAKEAEKKPISKETLCKEIETAAKSMSDEDKLKAWRLLAEMNGYIEKAAPATINNNNQQVINPVLIMPAELPDEEWERRAQANSKRLRERTIEHHVAS